MIQRYLIVWLVLSSLAALMWPEVFPAAVDPFVGSRWLLPWMIVVTMFCIGWILPRDEVRQVFRRWPLVFGGTAIQYLTMPTLAYLMGRLLGLQGDFFIGVVMVGCVPGAMASNVLTLNARGNTSYSVSLTTTATLLSPLAVPAALALALQADDSVDVGILLQASRDLLWTVVIPVVVGHLLSLRFPNWEPTARRIGPLVANLTILWIIAVVVGLNRGRLVAWSSDVPLAALLAALVGVNAGGYLAGYAGGAVMKLPEAMRRALTLEVGMQNAGLGAVLAGQLFAAREAIAIAPAMYTFGCMLTGTILSTVWSRRVGGPPTEESPPASSPAEVRRD
jgi:BASS family bile acid:Na+ symporter